MLFEVGSVVQVKVTDLVPVPFQMHLCMRLIISFPGEGKKGQGILQSSSSALRSIRSSFPQEEHQYLMLHVHVLIHYGYAVS